MAAVARTCRPGSDSGDRPRRLDVPRSGLARCRRPPPLPPSRIHGGEARLEPPPAWVFLSGLKSPSVLHRVENVRIGGGLKPFAANRYLRSVAEIQLKLRRRDAQPAERSTPLAPSLNVAARTDAAPVSRARPSPDETLALILARLDDDKAEDTTSIDLKGKTTLADYMVVASGRSHRHVGAIAEHLLEALGKAGIAPRPRSRDSRIATGC